MKIRIIAVLALFLALAMSCTDSKSGSEEGPKLEGNDFLVTIKTDLGEMKAVLYDQTPKHKENFLKLANEGFFDSLIFHRVINNFMIQGGDPGSRDAAPSQPLGSGGPGYTVPAEFVADLFHKKGALSAARQGDQVNPEKASSGSQFYIVHGQVTPKDQLAYDQQKIGEALQKCRTEMPDNEFVKELEEIGETQGQQAFVEKVFDSIETIEELTGMELSSTMSEEKVEAYSTVGGTPFLDDNYTVFGQVISGIDVIDRIATVQTAPGDRPIEDVRMYVTVEEMSKSDIAAKYGNPYIQ